MFFNPSPCHAIPLPQPHRSPPFLSQGPWMARTPDLSFTPCWGWSGFQATHYSPQELHSQWLVNCPDSVGAYWLLNVTSQAFTRTNHFLLEIPSFLDFPNYPSPGSPSASKTAFSSSLLQKHLFPFLPPEGWLPVSALSFLPIKHFISCKHPTHSHCHNQNQCAQGSYSSVCSQGLSPTLQMACKWQLLEYPQSISGSAGPNLAAFHPSFFPSQFRDPSGQPSWSPPIDPHLLKDKTQTQRPSTSFWCLSRSA